MERPRFASIGDLAVDVIIAGAAGHGARVRVTAGGSAANAAASAAGCGAEVTVIGRVGDDQAGRMLRAELELLGIRVQLSVDPAARTGTFVLLNGVVHVDRGANASMLPEHLPDTIRADAILVSGYLPAETVAASLERGRAEWVALTRGLLPGLLDGANAVFLDEHEARAITGAGPEQAARALGESFRLVCVTRGPRGAIAVLDGSTQVVLGDPSDSAPIDEPGAGLGAGDAFAAAFLVALARGADLAGALAAGVDAGAMRARDGLPLSRYG